MWHQVQRAGGPNTTNFWDFAHGSAQIDINATVPLNDIAGRPAKPDTDPASGVWGQLRDQTAAVVKDGGTFSKGVHGLAYPAGLRRVGSGHAPAERHPVHPGHQCLVGPLGQGGHNGKGLVEDAFDNVTKMVLNQDFTSGLTQPSPLLDYFPYVSPPPAS